MGLSHESASPMHSDSCSLTTGAGSPPVQTHHPRDVEIYNVTVWKRMPLACLLSPQTESVYVQVAPAFRVPHRQTCMPSSRAITALVNAASSAAAASLA